MGRKSTFTAAQKRDAVMGVISKRKTVSETYRELGISETTLLLVPMRVMPAIRMATGGSCASMPRPTTTCA